MVRLVLDVVPDAVEHLQEVVADLLALLDDVVAVAAEFDPPIAGVDIGELGELIFAGVNGHKAAAVRLGADMIHVGTVF